MITIEGKDLLASIERTIKANEAHQDDFGDDDSFNYYEGANDSLKELAVEFCLVGGYDYFNGEG